MLVLYDVVLLKKITTFSIRNRQLASAVEVGGRGWAAASAVHATYMDMLIKASFNLSLCVCSMPFSRVAIFWRVTLLALFFP
jgi:hypothetical protein